MLVMVQVTCGGRFLVVSDGVWVSDEHFWMFLPFEDGSYPGPGAFIHQREKVK